MVFLLSFGCLTRHSPAFDSRKTSSQKLEGLHLNRLIKALQVHGCSLLIEDEA